MKNNGKTKWLKRAVAAVMGCAVALTAVNSEGLFTFISAEEAVNIPAQESISTYEADPEETTVKDVKKAVNVASETQEDEGKSVTSVTREGEVAIDENNFPDEIFRSYVAECFDKDGNGSLSQSEIDGANYVYVRNYIDSDHNLHSITSLKGIEYLTKLLSLDCAYVGLSSLNLSKNTALTSLECNDNQLVSLDVSNCTALTSLNCHGNQLTYLNVSGCAALTSLDCGCNQLTSLDISNNTSLEILNCGGEYDYTALEYKKGNNLTSLDISNNKALTELDCSGNQLTFLDVSNNIVLKELDCSRNQLNALNLNNNTSLENFYCNDNVFRIPNEDTYDLSNLSAYGFDPAKASNWKGAIYDTDNNTIYNIFNDVTYTYDCCNDFSCEFTLSNGRGENLISISQTNFPDYSFNNYVGDNFDLNHDGELHQKELDAVEEIDVGRDNKGYLRSLKGIEYFKNLRVLDCSNNEIESIDLSQNTALEVLDISHNDLTALDLSNNIALKDLNICFCWLTLDNIDISKNVNLISLDCSRNNFADGLDISKYPMLEKYICIGCGLTSLDISKYPNLKYVDCGSNAIGSIDVSKNTALEELHCSSCGFTSIDVSKNSKLKVLDVGMNNLTSIDVTKNTELRELYCIANKLTTLDLSKNTKLEKLDIRNFYPDSKGGGELFGENFFESIDFSNNHELKYFNCQYTQIPELDFSACPNLTELDCGYCPITSLDISKCKSLERLECRYCDLSSLDLKKCTALKRLDFIGNNLTSLDISDCKVLTYLDCSQNNLDTLDISNCNNLAHLACSSNNIGILDISNCNALTYLACSSNNLDILDVSNCNALTYLDCAGNNLNKLDLKGNTELVILDCDYCGLTYLDVSNNTELEELSCSGNKLTSLDVSKNTSLGNLYCDNNIFIIPNASTYCLDNLTKYGFDSTKASNWTGATYNADTNTLSDFTAAEITYDYDCGNDYTATFTLKRDETVETTYTVTIPENVTVTIDGTAIKNGDKVHESDKLVITATAPEGQQLKSLKVNGTDFKSGGTYTVGKENVVITVEFEKIPEETTTTEEPAPGETTTTEEPAPGETTTTEKPAPVPGETTTTPDSSKPEESNTPAAPVISNPVIVTEATPEVTTEAPSTTPSTGDTTTPPSGDAVTEIIKSAKNDDVIALNPASPELPASAVEAIKGTDKTVKVTLSNGVTVSVNGKDVTEASAMDLEVITGPVLNTGAGYTIVAGGNIDSQILPDGTPSMEAIIAFELKQHGSYGAKVNITIPVGAEYNGKTATVYRYTDGTLEPVATAVVTDGNITITRDNASFYVIAIEDEQAPAGDSTGSSSDKGDNPSTGVGLSITAIAVLAVSGTVCGVVSRKKKNK